MRFMPGGEFEFDDDEGGFDEETEAMMADAFAKSNENREAEIKLAEKHMRTELLEKAIGVAKSNWFWAWMPNSMKLQKISEAYDTLKMLVD